MQIDVKFHTSLRCGKGEGENILNDAKPKMEDSFCEAEQYSKFYSKKLSCPHESFVKITNFLHAADEFSNTEENDKNAERQSTSKKP